MSNKYNMDNENQDAAASSQNTVEAEAVLHARKTGPKPKELVEGTITGLPVGRDRTVVPPDQVEELASLGCTDREIANFFGIKEDTLRYNFTDNLIKGREELKITLRRSMLRTAHSGNAAVLIFLAKNILGMSDQPVNTDDKKPLPWTDE